MNHKINPHVHLHQLLSIIDRCPNIEICDMMTDKNVDKFYPLIYYVGTYNKIFVPIMQYFQ